VHDVLCSFILCCACEQGASVYIKLEFTADSGWVMRV